MPRKRKHLDGEQHNYLVIVGGANSLFASYGVRRKVTVKCLLCDTEKAMLLNNLRSGRVKSCGCLRSAEGRKVQLEYDKDEREWAAFLLSCKRCPTCGESPCEMPNGCNPHIYLDILGL